MTHRFQLGFFLGSLLPLSGLFFLGHSERVSLVFGAGFLLVPALLWPRRLAGWLEGLQGFYERFNAARLRPAKAGSRQESVAGPDLAIRGNARNMRGEYEEPNPANAKPKAETAGGTQDIVVETLVNNYNCPKGKARSIAAQVAGIQDEDARVIAAMRMVRA